MISNITQKLMELVKQRKTPKVVTKQGSNYKISRGRSYRSYGSVGYSYDDDE